MKIIEMLNTPKFVMLIGAPGSGKSTWIDDFVSSSPDAWVVLSTDAIIEKYADDKNVTYAEAFAALPFKKVQSKFNIQAKDAFKNQYNVIWDQTNMTVKSRKKKLSQVPDNYETAAITFEIDREELRRRGEQRKGETGKEVPEKIIDQMIDSYVRPTKAEGFSSIRIINK